MASSNRIFKTLAFCAALLGAPAGAADYQWSALVDGVVSTETGAAPRAFLWVPPDCGQIRAVVVGQHNMQEEPILEHPVFRAEMARLCFAEIWITPAMGSNHFRFDRGAGDMLNRLLGTLAARSGYGELAQAPLVPIGHSAMASFGWDMAAWDNDRVLAVVSTSGMWPFFREEGTDINKSPDWGNRTIDGVPGLVIKGEYEVQGNMRDGWYANLKGSTLKDRPMTVLTHVVEPGGGHFEVSERRVALIALFLRKAAQYRLPKKTPPGGATKLSFINPQRAGWLFDGWQLDTRPAAPAAPVAAYQGPRADAFWAFDAEMAGAIEAFQARFRGKKPVLLAYRQDGAPVRPRPTHAMVHLAFKPMDDGLTFQLHGGFWDRVPGDGKVDPVTGREGAGSWGNFLVQDGRKGAAGDPLPPMPGAEASAMRIARICGPVRQLAPDTFAIRFGREGTENVKRSNSAWFALTWPGNDDFKQMVQQAELRFPLKNTTGLAQELTFPAVGNQSLARGGLKPVQLGATSSAGLPVHYYVREGPAEVSDDGTLTFTAIPKRAKFPIAVTVVAWQWGRATEPRLQSARPLEQQFHITR